MPNVWAKPELKWKGFAPCSYSLDMKRVWELPLKNDSTNEQTTIGAVVEKFRGQKVDVDDGLVSVTLKSQSQETVVSGPTVHLKLLTFL